MKYDVKNMYSKEKLSLRAKLTLLIGFIVLVSILTSIGIAYILSVIWPITAQVPDIVQLSVLSFIIAVILARLTIRVFSEPIGHLRNGMRKVTNGDFDVELNTKTSLAEVNDLINGFNIMVKELKSTEILQTDFISNVSHEIKTPISAIEGYTTLLQGTDNIDEIENEYIEKILDSTRRLSSLVSNILLMSKVENQSIQTNKTLYDLDEQIREIIVSLETMWEPKNIDFDVDLESVKYLGNENLIYHIWSNLINNAIKFSPENDTIKMRLFEKDDKIVFFIENNGPQLSEQALKHIFDKFYQEDTSHKSEGNGLGLALVKKILTLCGGEILAENISDSGCRFTVVLDRDTNTE